MRPRPRVLLADEHALILEALRRMLSATCEVVGAVTDGQALIDAARRLAPDVVLLDIPMPRLNGIDACRLLLPELPGIRWIFLTASEEPEIVREAFHLGASAFLLKRSTALELFTAIQKAMNGERYLTPLVTSGVPADVFLDQPARPHSGDLTGRQRQVLQLLAEGRTMKEIGGLLHVAPRTVAFHKYTIMKRVGAKNGAGLVQYAVKRGLLGP